MRVCNEWKPSHHRRHRVNNMNRIIHVCSSLHNPMPNRRTISVYSEMNYSSDTRALISTYHSFRNLSCDRASLARLTLGITEYRTPYNTPAPFAMCAGAS